MSTSISKNVAPEASCSVTNDASADMIGIKLALQPGESGPTRGNITVEVWGKLSATTTSAVDNSTTTKVTFMHRRWEASYELSPGAAPVLDDDILIQSLFDDSPVDASEGWDMYNISPVFGGDNNDTLMLSVSGPGLGFTTGLGNAVGVYQADLRMQSTEIHFVVD